MEETAQPVPPSSQNPVGPVPAGAQAPPLAYEETPEIPVHEPPKKFGSCLKTIGVGIVFVLVFIVGVWLSSYVRQFLPSSTHNAVTPEKSTEESASPSSSLTASPSAVWKTYEIVNGVTKKSIAGITFQLPESVLPPICDGQACTSQGTYLPGGTRFTIAARGAGQSLRDYRGTIVSDSAGTPFDTRMATVSGQNALDFSGTFIGNTLSGYAFSAMHGVMIEANASVSIEVNHFTPYGLTTDFQADDVLFNEILKTFTFGAVRPSATPIATSSAQ